MSLRSWWRARGLGSNRNRLEHEMDDEMRFHLEMEIEQLMRRGMSREQAEREARLSFGNVDRFKEEARDMMAMRWIGDFRRDVVFAIRSLRRSPFFTIVAVLALGIGIGANATAFGFVDAVAFRKLPIKDPDQLVAVFAKQGDATLEGIAYPNVEDLRRRISHIGDAAAFVERAVSVKTSRGPVVAWAVHASDNYFSVLKLDAVHGRLLQPGDLYRPVAVISESFWKREFGSDPRIAGQTTSINGVPFTIVGIAPGSFRGTRLLTYEPSVWIPAGASSRMLTGSNDWITQRGRGGFNVIARIERGSIQSAERVIASVGQSLSSRFPEAFGDLTLITLPNSAPINPWLAPRERVELLGKLLVAGVCLVLLIACADVANLLLARMTVRRQEIGIRIALGASGGRLFRLLLTESLVLAFLGTLAAFPLAYVALKGAIHLVPPLDFHPSFSPSLDGRVIAFTAITSVLSAIAFGIAPLLQLRSNGLNPDQLSDTRLSVASGSRLRSALVVGQVAVSVLALVAAALFYRGLAAARAIDVGFDVSGAMVFTLDPVLTVGYDEPRIKDLYRRLDVTLKQIPGVTSVARTSAIPLDGNSRTLRTFAGSGSASAEANTIADFFVVSDEYFSALGIPIVRGRPFSSADTTSEESVVVNETLAKRYWPNTSALDQVIAIGAPTGSQVRVIGVAKMVTSRRLGDKPRPMLWLSIAQNPQSRVTFIVRASGDTAAMLPKLASAVHSIDPNLAVMGLRTLKGHVAIAYSAAENGALMGIVFGTMAAILAAAGLFGTVAYNVSQRTREIGVRRALGATSTDIVRLVGKSSLRLTFLGIAIALVGILLIPRKMSVLLYGVSPHDPLLITAACAAFLLIAVIASLGPAWKALQIEPHESLRGN